MKKIPSRSAQNPSRGPKPASKHGTKPSSRSKFGSKSSASTSTSSPAQKAWKAPGPSPKMDPDKPEYPMRINKYLAKLNLTTRRGGDELIAKKKVFLNGKLAQLGDQVQEGDHVEVKHSGIRTDYLYYAYYKPIGVTTHSPMVGEKDILQSSNLKGVFPVGRLDKNSSGLIILTNDGRLTDKLLNPDREHEKEYQVSVVNSLRPSFKESMEKGVDLGEYVTKPCKVKVVGDRTFLITLTEGKKHQIRRMCEAMHNDVKDLHRTRIMNIKIGKLAPNSSRKIEGVELDELKKKLGM
jgi:23S rRNA pseudouridine2604 synthase